MQDQGRLSQNRDLKIRGQRQRRKRHFKSEVTVFQCWSRLFQLPYFSKYRRFLREFNSWDHPSPEGLERQKNLSFFCVPTKRTWNWAISLCCRVVTAKKCTNKVCCTCRVVVLLIICSYCFFDVPVAVAFVASKGPLWYIQRVKKKEKKENKSKREKRKKSERKKRKKNINVTFYFLCLRSSPVLKVRDTDLSFV